jgi:hypothetical protein
MELSPVAVRRGGLSAGKVANAFEPDMDRGSLRPFFPQALATAEFLEDAVVRGGLHEQ